MASSSQPNSQPHDEIGSSSAGLFFCALPGVDRPFISKVPERFRKGNEEFYRSRVVTIGPYHDVDAHLRCVGIKLQYGEAFAIRYCCTNDTSKGLERILGEKARDYYCFKQIPRDLGKNMMVDGIFLLELMLRFHFPEYRKAENEDPIFKSTRIIVDVCRDILLMENQLPFIVLEEIYQRFVAPYPQSNDVSLRDLACHFFKAVYNNNAHRFDHLVAFPRQFDHLVAFVQSLYSSGSRPSLTSDGDDNVNDTTITVQLVPPSVSKLHEAGVKLEKLSWASGLNIEFDRGRLKIPHLDYWTGTLFLNVMVFEESVYFLAHSGNYVSQFMFFMGWMIRTSKDVDILIDSGIISRMLGSNTDLVALFDRISKMGWPHDYYNVCQELNRYCTSNPHKWKATLKRDYFDTPWKLASTIAAVVLLLLTLMQTVCSFLSLKP